MVRTKNENKTGFVFVRVKIVMLGLTVTQEFCKLSNVRICSFVCLTFVDASMESLMMNFHKTLDASHVLLLSPVSFQASAPLPCDFVDWTLPWLVPTSSALRIVNTVHVHRAQLKNSVNIISAIEGTRSFFPQFLSEQRNCTSLLLKIWLWALGQRKWFQFCNEKNCRKAV